jgi:hypothetical protein
MPTAASRYSRERLGEITAEEKALVQAEKEAGLSGAEREAMQRQVMAPVQALARESRLREEAAAASGGATTSAGAQVRARREARRAVQERATQAGLAVEQAHLQTAAQELAQIREDKQRLAREEAELIAYKDARQRQQIQAGVGLLGGVAGLAGQYAGAQAIKGMPAGQLEGMDPLVQRLYMEKVAGQGGGQPSSALELLALQRLVQDQ